MTITTDNYEEYFYQYCEGELTADERAAVEAFVTQHPELAEELSLYDPALKLEMPPMAYPDKAGLLRRETKVIPLWRWAVAACVAAVLIGGVWLMWPNDNAPQQTGMVAQNRQSATTMKPIGPMAQKQEEQSPIVVKSTELIAQSTEPATPVQEEAIESLPPYEPPMTEESALLAEADPMPISQQEDTVVIEYIEMTIFPTSQSPMEVVQVAYQPTVGDRFRAFRSRVSNTLRDYAYQSYAETRGEIRTRFNY
jgi:hypothetical protein